MTRRKGLVLDANILLRAVFGQRARELLEAFEDAVIFYSPDVCFDDARKYIPDVSSRRRIDPLPGLAVLEEVSNIVEPVDQEVVRRLRNRGAGAPAWQADAFPKVRHCYAQSVASGLSGVASGQAHHGIAWRAELGRSRCNDEAWQVGAIAAEDPGWLKGPLLYH
jgi:PIN domain